MYYFAIFDQKIYRFSEKKKQRFYEIGVNRQVENLFWSLNLFDDELVRKLSN